MVTTAELKAEVKAQEKQARKEEERRTLKKKLFALKHRKVLRVTRKLESGAKALFRTGKAVAKRVAKTEQQRATQIRQARPGRAIQQQTQMPFFAEVQTQSIQPATKRIPTRKVKRRKVRRVKRRKRRIVRRQQAPQQRAFDPIFDL